MPPKLTIHHELVTIPAVRIVSGVLSQEACVQRNNASVVLLADGNADAGVASDFDGQAHS